MNSMSTASTPAPSPHNARSVLNQQPERVTYDQLSPGLYLLKQRSLQKGVDHYAILDIGNRLERDWNYGQRPAIVHQTPPTLRPDWAQDTGEWEIIGQVVDESGARARIAMVAIAPNYDLFGNNCEHFARFVATGVRASHQVRGYCLIGALVAIAIIANQRVSGARLRA